MLEIGVPENAEPKRGGSRCWSCPAIVWSCVVGAQPQEIAQVGVQWSGHDVARSLGELPFKLGAEGINQLIQLSLSHLVVANDDNYALAA